MRATVFSAAKLNLFLAITGRRPDGFHDLVSLVAPLEFGDELVAVAAPPGEGFSLVCDDPRVPVDASNLVLRAAAVFARRTGWSGGARFELSKRIPMGAGLGGGSSNAVAALRALNRLAHDRADASMLAEMAAELGSDCPLFLADAPVVMRGRGERVELLPRHVAERIRGRRVVVFKPSFGIATPWAYARLVARGADYLDAGEAERRLGAWTGGTAPLEALLLNSMEPAAFEKYIALPVFLAQLREAGVAARMSGSGSACFALLDDAQDSAPVVERVRSAWGAHAWVTVTRLA